MDPTDDDAARRAELAFHRRRATLVLAGAGGLFLATGWAADQGGFGLRLLHATAEAALVGGLADWFAVTALFRRPMGLPIPHTAIVPASKDRIAEGLGRFIEKNFLDPDLIRDRLRDAGLARRLATLMAEDAFARGLAQRFTGAIPVIFESAADGDLRRFLGEAVQGHLRGLDLAPLLGKGLRVIVETGQDGVILDAVGQGLRKVLSERRGTLDSVIGEKTGWWVPSMIDKRIARAVADGLDELLTELSIPGSRHRISLRRQLLAAARELEYSPDWAAKVSEIKSDLLGRPEISGTLDALWDGLRQALLDDARAPNSRIEQALAGSVQSLGVRLLDDPAMLRRLDRRLIRIIQAQIVPWRAEIARFVSDVVKSWDAETVADRMELAVGRDLQYIRLNGTAVGGLLGALLFLLAEAMKQAPPINWP